MCLPVPVVWTNIRLRRRLDIIMHTLQGFLDMFANLEAVGISCVAGIIYGYSGFGGALFMVPLLSLLMAPPHAVAATMIASLLGQAQLTWQNAPRVRWQECSPFLAAAIVATPIGIAVLTRGDPALVRRLLGAGTIAMGLLLSTGWVYRGSRGFGASALLGALTGAFGGATGQGGPIAVAYFLAAPVEAAVQRANIVITVMGLTLMVVAGLLAAGAIDAGMLLTGLALSIPFTAGTWAGSRLFKLVEIANYRRVVVGLLLLAGLIAIMK